jgi:hypothetical protein
MTDLVAAEVRSLGAIALTEVTVTNFAAGHGAHQWAVHARAYEVRSCRRTISTNVPGHHN